MKNRNKVIVLSLLIVFIISMTTIVSATDNDNCTIEMKTDKDISSKQCEFISSEEYDNDNYDINMTKPTIMYNNDTINNKNIKKDYDESTLRYKFSLLSNGTFLQDEYGLWGVLEYGNFSYTIPLSNFPINMTINDEPYSINTRSGGYIDLTNITINKNNPIFTTPGNNNISISINDSEYGEYYNSFIFTTTEANIFSKIKNGTSLNDSYYLNLYYGNEDSHITLYNIPVDISVNGEKHNIEIDSHGKLNINKSIFDESNPIFTKAGDNHIQITFNDITYGSYYEEIIFTTSNYYVIYEKHNNGTYVNNSYYIGDLLITNDISPIKKIEEDINITIDVNGEVCNITTINKGQIVINKTIFNENNSIFTKPARNNITISFNHEKYGEYYNKTIFTTTPGKISIDILYGRSELKDNYLIGYLEYNNWGVLNFTDLYYREVLGDMFVNLSVNGETHTIITSREGNIYINNSIFDENNPIFNKIGTNNITVFMNNEQYGTFEFNYTFTTILYQSYPIFRMINNNSLLYNSYNIGYLNFVHPDENDYISNKEINLTVNNETHIIKTDDYGWIQINNTVFDNNNKIFTTTGDNNITIHYENDNEEYIKNIVFSTVKPFIQYTMNNNRTSLNNSYNIGTLEYGNLYDTKKLVKFPINITVNGETHQTETNIFGELTINNTIFDEYNPIFTTIGDNSIEIYANNPEYDEYTNITIFTTMKNNYICEIINNASIINNSYNIAILKYGNEEFSKYLKDLVINLTVNDETHNITTDYGYININNKIFNRNNPIFITEGINNMSISIDNNEFGSYYFNTTFKTIKPGVNFIPLEYTTYLKNNYIIGALEYGDNINGYYYLERGVPVNVTVNGELHTIETRVFGDIIINNSIYSKNNPIFITEGRNNIIISMDDSLYGYGEYYQEIIYETTSGNPFYEIYNNGTYLNESYLIGFLRYGNNNDSEYINNLLINLTVNGEKKEIYTDNMGKIIINNTIFNQKNPMFTTLCDNNLTISFNNTEYGEFINKTSFTTMKHYFKIFQERNTSYLTSYYDRVFKLTYGNDYYGFKRWVNFPLNLTVNGEKQSVFSDDRGCISINNLTFDKYNQIFTTLGTNNITISINDEKYGNYSENFTYTTIKSNLTKSYKLITNPLTSVPINESITISGYVYDLNNNTKNDVDLTINIDNKKIYISTDSNGYYSYDFIVKKAIKYDIFTTINGYDITDCQSFYGLTNQNNIILTNDNYGQYFNIYDGTTTDIVKENDTLILSDEFIDKVFFIDKPGINLIGEKNSLITNGQIFITEDAGNNTITNITINTTYFENAIFNEAKNVIITNNTITITNKNWITEGIKNEAENVIISNNIIGVYGPAKNVTWGYGDHEDLPHTLGIYTSGRNSTIKNNNISVSLAKGGTIENYGTIDGIEVQGDISSIPTDITIRNNTINVTDGRFVYGINALRYLNNVNIVNNKIYVNSERYADGIQIGNHVNNSLIENNEINAYCFNKSILSDDNEALGFGIITTSMGGGPSNNITVQNNKIILKSTITYGIEVFESYNSTYNNNTITTKSSYSMGIGASNSGNNTFKNNNINLTSNNTNTVNNIVEKIKPANTGIHLQTDSGFSTVSGNNIHVYDKLNKSLGISIQNTNNTLIENNYLIANNLYGDNAIEVAKGLKNITLYNNTPTNETPLDPEEIINQQNEIIDELNAMINYLNEIITNQSTQIQNQSEIIDELNLNNTILENENNELTQTATQQDNLIEELHNNITQLNNTINTLTNQNNEKENIINNLTNTKQELENNITKLNNQIDLLNEENNNINYINQQLNNTNTILKTENTNLNSQNNQLNQQITTLNNINHQQNNTIQTLNNTINELTYDNDKLNSEIANQINTNNQLKQNNTKLNQQITSLNNTIKLQNNTILNLNDTNRRLNELIDEQRSVNKQLNDLIKDYDNIITNLEQENLDNTVLINQLTREKTNLEKELIDKNKNINNLTKTIGDLYNDKNQLRNQINDVTKSLLNKDNQISQLNENLKQLNNTNNNLNSTVKLQNNTLNNLQNDNKNLNNTNKQLQNNITQLNNTINTLEKQFTKNTTVINVEKINGRVGSQVQLKAMVKDQNGKAINEGKVVFKVNGITLKDSESNPLYSQVTNGIATLNYVIPKSWMKNTTSIEAVFSETIHYKSSRNTTTKNSITPGNVKLKISDMPTHENGDKMQFVITVTDERGNTINGGTVILKANGVTLKDSKSNPLQTTVKNGVAIIDYNITLGARTHDITAVYAYTGYNRIEAKNKLTVTKGEIFIRCDPVITNKNSTQLLATVFDKNKNKITYDINIGIKINGASISTTTTKKGLINITVPTKFKVGTYLLVFTAGETGAYKSDRLTTVIMKQ